MKKELKQIPLLPEFDKFIKVSASGKRLNTSGKRITLGVIENYKYTHKLLAEFEATTKEPLRIILINKVSLQILQKEKNYWLKFYRNFSNFLYKKKGYYDNYVAGVFKIIKTFFNYLLLERAMPVGVYHKLFKILSVQVTPIVLTPEQLNFLITNKEFNESLPSYLQRTKDIFVVGCTVGLRVGDLMRLKQKNVITTAQGTYLSIHTEKTGTEVKIPLPDYVLEILKKYKKKECSFILPRLAKTNINKQLKQIAEKANWTYILPKNTSKQGKVVELTKKHGKSYRFCDHITAHTMRRTAITTLLILGVPELVVRKISGHAAGSKEFFKYISIANDYSNEKIKDAHKSLLDLQSFQKNNEIKLL